MANTALLIIYVFILLGLGINMAQDGKPKTGRHNFVFDLVITILNLLLLWWALGWQFL